MSFFGLRCFWIKTKSTFLSTVYRPPSEGLDLGSTDHLCAYLNEYDNKFPQLKKVSFVVISMAT